MKVTVGHVLLHRMYEHYIRAVEAELRTQALLLAVPYYEATGVLEKMRRDAQVKKKMDGDMLDAFRYAMQQISVRPIRDKIQGKRPDQLNVDDLLKVDFKKLEDILILGGRTSGKSQMMQGIPDSFYMAPAEPVASPPRAIAMLGRPAPAPRKQPFNHQAPAREQSFRTRMRSMNRNY